jgi:hypothetical protein
MRTLTTKTREKDENTKERGPYKKNTINKCFESMCEHLANGKIMLSEIFQRFQSIYSSHYKRPVPEVTWIYGPTCIGEEELADKYIDSYDSFEKAGNYYLGPTDYNKNLVYHLDKEKYSDVLQM